MSEFALRAFSPVRYNAWMPHTRVSFHLPPGRAPGIHGESYFTINADGIRGEDFRADQRYRILAVGGSTTECLLLDDTLAWPYLLQESLNERAGSHSIWVGNIGRSGDRAAHHGLQLTYLLPQYPHIDVVLVLVGINDLQHRLARDTQYRPAQIDYLRPDPGLVQETFAELPRSYRPGPIYKRTEMWRRLRILRSLTLGWVGLEGHRQDERGNNLVWWRRHRQAAARIRDTLPDLSPALEEYYHHLNGLVDQATRFNARVILLTQPTMWRPRLPPTLSNLLWSGGVGDFQAQQGKEYYSVEALATGMELYNQTLLRVCRERALECLDLAAALPKDTTVFYDDVHFNESGAVKVADLLRDHLQTRASMRGLFAATAPPARTEASEAAGLSGFPTR